MTQQSPKPSKKKSLIDYVLTMLAMFIVQLSVLLSPVAVLWLIFR